MTGPRSPSPETQEAYETTETEREGAPGLLLLFSAAHARMPPVVSLAESELLVGRESDADLYIPDEAVSRRHATLTRSNDVWTVEDQGSRNGTFVDGQRVTRAALHDGARLRFGDALFSFVARNAEDYLPYGIDGIVRGAPPDDVAEMIGGLKIRTLASEIGRVARTDLTCLVYGETGTGKELIARALHRLSGRPGALQAINCAAVPTQLFESELFGYKKGAFSGADRDKLGLIQGANRGTLFLDEVGEMPLEVQAKLLRVLQQREVLPLGAVRSEPIDVRIVAATHRDLEERVAAGQFRPDLLARLDEHRLLVPPLRERKEDIYMLATTFIRKHAKRPMALPFDVIDALLAYDWPFNVRELESAMKRAVALDESNALTRKNLPAQVMRQKADVRASSAAAGEENDDEPGEFHRGAPKEAHLRALLAEHAGNIAAVARALGKRRMQVQRTMQKYRIAPSEYRSGTPDPDDGD